MKKVFVISIITVMILSYSLFLNARPVQAQVQTVIGILQMLSIFLPSSNNANTESDKKPTVEELIRNNPHLDIVTPAFKQAVKDRSAKRGKKLEFGEIDETNGKIKINVEDYLINNCFVAWYNNAQVDSAQGVIVLFITMPNDKGIMTLIGSSVFDSSVSEDNSKLQSLRQNQEEKNIFLQERVQKFLKIYKDSNKS
jgi:hypothetical protein